MVKQDPKQLNEEMIVTVPMTQFEATGLPMLGNRRAVRSVTISQEAQEKIRIFRKKHFNPGLS